VKAYELKTHLENMMRETGQGSNDVVLLTEEGEVFDIMDVNYDSENKFFHLGGVIREES
jgi:hypothetical protein